MEMSNNGNEESKENLEEEYPIRGIRRTGITKEERIFQKEARKKKC